MKTAEDGLTGWLSALALANRLSPYYEEVEMIFSHSVSINLSRSRAVKIIYGHL